jgi:hypothetical protein
MERAKVNDVLEEIALAKRPMESERAMKNLAVALMHIAKSVDEIERTQELDPNLAAMKAHLASRGSRTSR